MAWTTEQLFADISSDAVDLIVNTKLLRNVILCLLTISLAYPTGHFILNRFNGKYRDLKHTAQNTVLQHFVEASFFTISLPTCTYLFMSLSFEEPYDDENHGTLKAGAIDRFRAMLSFMFLLTAMYAAEIILRYRKLNPLVLFHHMCTIILAVWCFIFPTAAVFKVNAALVYFANYEMLTFYGLVMKTLLPLHPATPRMMVAGMVLFGTTRPVQLGWILMVLIGSWDDNDTWQAIFLIFSAVLVGTVQCMALKIHYNVWRRCVARQMKVADIQDVDKNTKEETFCDSV